MFIGVAVVVGPSAVVVNVTVVEVVRIIVDADVVGVEINAIVVDIICAFDLDVGDDVTAIFSVTYLDVVLLLIKQLT